MKPNLEFARDIFMFLFYCRGMSFVDAAFLKKSDVQNGMISYRRHKTNQLLHIKLGHDSLSTTQIYLASIDASTIDRVNELIIKDL